MSVTVTVNGTSYTIPSTSERGWGSQVTAWIQNVSSNTLQKSGGSFTLTADVDFGASKGLLAAYFSTRSALPASSGVVKLSNAEVINWRNAANTADVGLSVNASDVLTYRGVALTPSGTAYAVGDILYASSTTALSKLPIGSSGQVLKVSAALPSWGSPSSTLSYKAKTHADTGYTVLNTDDFILWTLTNASNDTATLPDNTTNAGKVFRIKLAATTAAFNKLTVSRAGSDTFTLEDGTTGATSLVVSIGGEQYDILSDGAGVWQVLQHSVPIVSASSYRASSDFTIGTSETEIIFNTSDNNPQSAYSTSTGRFTAPIAGRYEFMCPVTSNMGGTAAAELDLWFYKNGSGVKYGMQLTNALTNSKSYIFTCVTQIQLAAGDYVSFWGQSITNTSTLDSGARRTNFYAKRIGN